MSELTNLLIGALGGIVALFPHAPVSCLAWSRKIGKRATECVFANLAQQRQPRLVLSSDDSSCALCGLTFVPQVPKWQATGCKYVWTERL